MRLSAEQFAELAASFEGYEKNGDPERRRASRIELSTRVKIAPVNDGTPGDVLTVSVADFSPRGLAFIHTSDLAAGAQFVTHLPRKHGGRVEMLCTVAHAKPLADGLFRIGCEFTCVLPENHAAASNALKNNSSNQAAIDKVRQSILS